MEKLFFEINIYDGVNEEDISKNFIYNSNFQEDNEGNIFLVNPNNTEFIFYIKTKDTFKVRIPKGDISKKSIIEYDLLYNDALRVFYNEIKDLGLYRFVENKPLRI